MSEGPYNYRGARWFVDSIVTDVEARLSALEKVVTTSAPTLGECRINKYRSDVCERGTKGCDRLDHAVAQTLNSQPQAAEPLIHWRDKPQNIALLAVERGDPVDCDGTFACPICGKDEPHQHSSEEIAKFRTTQSQVAEPTLVDTQRCNKCGEMKNHIRNCNDEHCFLRRSSQPQSAEPKGMAGGVTVPRVLLQDLTDDVEDYSASRKFKPCEAKWRANLLARARALLAKGE